MTVKPGLVVRLGEQCRNVGSQEHLLSRLMESISPLLSNLT